MQDLWRETMAGKEEAGRDGKAAGQIRPGTHPRGATGPKTGDSKSLSVGNDAGHKSAGMMVTRSQFISLLKTVPKLPSRFIESWFDALALRFAHVTPPPAELTLDFRRLLAAAGNPQHVSSVVSLI